MSTLKLTATTDRIAERLEQGLAYYREEIPLQTQQAVREYVLNHIPQGHFLTAVLSNDLFTAVSRADHYNVKAIPALCQLLYNHVPAACFGSPERAETWLRRSEEIE